MKLTARFYLYLYRLDDSLSASIGSATANQEKGQRTPFQVLDSMDDAWSYPVSLNLM